MNPPLASTGSSGSKALVFVLLLAVAGLGAWAFLLKRDLATANEDLAAARKSSNVTASAPGEVQRLKARVAELESRVASAPAPSPAPAAEAPAPKAANPLAAMAQLMTSNPAMKNLVATTQRRALETQYAELLDALQLTPEQRTRFIDLLAERQAATTDARMKLASADISADERRALAQEMQQANQATQGTIRELLGDEKFAAFRSYTDQQAERTQVNMLKASLASSGAPLSAEQAASLSGLMYEERKGFTFTRNPGAGAADPTAALNSQTVETNLREQEQLDERIANRAAVLLSPDQVNALRQNQAARRQAARASIELSRQMLGVGQK